MERREVIHSPPPLVGHFTIRCEMARPDMFTIRESCKTEQVVFEFRVGWRFVRNKCLFGPVYRASTNKRADRRAAPRRAHLKNKFRHFFLLPGACAAACIYPRGQSSRALQLTAFQFVENAIDSSERKQPSRY